MFQMLAQITLPKVDMRVCLNKNKIIKFFPKCGGLAMALTPAPLFSRPHQTCTTRGPLRP